MKNARRIVDSRPGRIVLWIAYVLVSPPLLLMSAVGIFTGAVHALAVGPFDSRFFDSALPLFYGMAGLVGLIAAAARLVFSG
ncbi:MAG: hypothetical protein JNK75_11610, partial [Betaproteobacteria bacterium]|nr:hypothetical protein [Betaproteobacteria bacterium]